MRCVGTLALVFLIVVANLFYFFLYDMERIINYLYILNNFIYLYRSFLFILTLKKFFLFNKEKNLLIKK